MGRAPNSAPTCRPEMTRGRFFDGYAHGIAMLPGTPRRHSECVPQQREHGWAWAGRTNGPRPIGIRPLERSTCTRSLGAPWDAILKVGRRKGGRYSWCAVQECSPLPTRFAACLVSRSPKDRCSSLLIIEVFSHISPLLV